MSKLASPFHFRIGRGALSLLLLSMFIAGCSVTSDLGISDDLGRYSLGVSRPEVPQSLLQPPRVIRRNWRIAYIGNDAGWEGLRTAASVIGVELHRLASINGPVQAGTDGLIVGPSDGENHHVVARAVERAKANGWPVVTVDAESPPPGILTNIVFDDFRGGMRLAEWLTRSLGEGQVLILGGPAEEEAATDRVLGMVAGIEAGNLVLAGVLETGWGGNGRAKELVAAYLKAGNDAAAILCPDDPSAISEVIPVLRKLRRRDIVVTGFDAGFELDMVKKDRLLATTARPFDRMTATALALLLRNLETGERFYEEIPYPLVPVISAENVEEFE